MRFRNLLKKAGASALLGVTVLSLPMTAVNAWWSDADEAEYHKKYVMKFIDIKPQLVQKIERAANPQCLSIPNGLEGIKRMFITDILKNRDILPTQLTPDDTERFKEILQSMPRNIREEFVHDIDEAYVAADEDEKAKVVDSFLNTAWYLKSMLVETFAEEDYLGTANRDYPFQSPLMCWTLDHDEYRSHVEKSFHSIDQYRFKYAVILDEHKEEIVQKHDYNGSPALKRIFLHLLDMQESQFFFNLVIELKEKTKYSDIPVEVYEDVIRKSASYLDPVLKNEICRDFHKVINDPGLTDKVEKLHKTFAFCKATFELKRELYIAINKAYQDQLRFPKTLFLPVCKTPILAE